MSKHGFMTAKAIGNRMKSKGLQKLRWFCQMCEKQCRDENGFKCHCASESHQRQMTLFSHNPRKFLEDFSREFKSSYLSQLSRAHGTKRCAANKVYQELIADRNHLHMNATRWGSLSEFVTHLGREGLCHVEDTEKGWFISWIDNSPAALERKAAILKKERSEMTDEERQRKLLEQQIEKARESEKEPTEPVIKELRRENEDEPVKLTMNLNLNKPKLVTSNPFKTKKFEPVSKPIKLSALVKPNTNSSKPSISSSLAPKKPLSQLESIFLEETSKKRRF